jgi:hypothetical protein
MKLKFFAPIIKIDVAKREVYGVMAEEAIDKSKEIFDYETSKPFVKAWMDQFQKTTHGQSFGNVRAMHSPIAAGKIIGLQFDDAAKNIPIAVKVVDDNEWKKCAEGVYTGFSIGGSYIKKWLDGTNTRYTAKPSEVSLVDNPCMYGATFTAVKADGAEEMRKFEGGELGKSMWDIGTLASMLENLAWMRDCLASERDYEGDKSQVPEKLASWIEEGTTILKQLVEEETSELTSGANKGEQMDPKELQALKDRLAKAEADNAALLAEKATRDAQVAKAAADAKDAETEALKKKVAELEESNKAINEGLQKLLATPEAPKAAANANGGTSVTKDADGEAAKAAAAREAELAKMSPEERALALIKGAHASGGVPETPRGPQAR